MSSSETTALTGSPSSTTTTTDPAPAAPERTAPATEGKARGFRPLGMRPQTPSTTKPGPSDVPSSAAADPLDSPATGGTRSSSPKGRSKDVQVNVDKGAISEILRELVFGLSGWVHERFAQTDEERQAEVWLAEDKDQERIADPVANIAHRHSLGSVDPDTRDLIYAGIGVAAYLSKNVKKAWLIRRGRKQRAAVDPIRETPQEQQ